MAVLTVGSGQQFQTIAAAVAASHDGDVVQVQAGTYVNDFAEITTKITIEGVGGLAHIVASVAPPNGKAILTTDTDVHLDHLELSGAAVSDGNGAGIRYQGGALVVTNSYIHDNQDGILGAAVPTGSITIDGSEFSHNGTGDGRTHNIYIGNIASFTLTNSYVHDAVVGHEVKSRAANNVITGNRIQNNATGTGSYLIDLPNGGVANIQNNVLEKGPDAQNPFFITSGEEGSVYAASSLSVTGNTIVNDRGSSAQVIRNSTAGPATLSGNALWNIPASAVSGSVSVSGNTALASRPTVDTSSALSASSPAPLPSGPGPSAIPAFDFGQNGAIAPNGTVLTVGAGKQFSTIAAAVAAAQDGDTIAIDAGTYVNDFAYIAKKLVLEGVGGTVNVVSTGGALWHQAIFITDADVTFKGFDLSGASVDDSYGGNAAAIRMHSGNLTLIDVHAHGNQQGVYATPDRPGGSVTIIGSEIDHNGSTSEAGVDANVAIGAVQALTVVGSYVHDAVAGDEVRTRSVNTIIDASRIGDGATGGGGSDVDLPNGGNAVIENSIIEKGSNTAPAAMIAFGQNGAAGGRLQVVGSTLINDGPSSTVGVSNPSSGAVSMTSDTVWGLPYSQTVEGAGSVASTGRLDTAPVFSTASLSGAVDGVLRFFDPVTGTHFLTSSISEADTLFAARPELGFEGIGFAAASAQDAASIPVYRFFDVHDGTHFYTASAAERDQVAATRADLVFEGIGFYEHATAQPGDAPVYRFFDTIYGTHFLTDSAGERASIIATRPDLHDEGIAFYSPGAIGA